jgi:hypothetical protein
VSDFSQKEEKANAKTEKHGEVQSILKWSRQYAEMQLWGEAEFCESPRPSTYVYSGQYLETIQQFEQKNVI